MRRRPTVRFGPTETVDFVVVGSGAAGGVMAKELSTAGYTVLVLEQGPRVEPDQFDHDELGHLIRGRLMNDPKVQPQTYRKNESEEAKPGPRRLGYHRLVGGGSVMFTANYWRFRDADFNEAARLGPIKGASLTTWPIGYQDLEPYYTKAEWELGVSGEVGPSDPPRSKPYPLPPLPVKSSGVLFERGARALGLHPQPAPMAILSQPYNGRLGCQHCGFCFGFGCEFRAKSSTLWTVIPVAEATGRCEIRPHSYAGKIEVDARGRATGVMYFDENKKENFQAARAVVLCCNGAETPRLLLMSASNLFPNGLANSSGFVGKHLMFNGYCGASGLFDRPINDYKSVADTRLLFDFYESDPKRGFYGGGAIDARGPTFPVRFALGGLPPKAPEWGAEYKRMLPEYFTRSMAANGHTTTLPVETNSVSLDPKLKDDWGLPAIRVTFQDHPDDLANERFFQKKCEEIMHAAGAKRVWSQPVRPQTGGVHLLGTCRMGNDPKTSVVDKYHRTHDVPNLFLCDGSSLVTGGRGQPTATIQALAYRAGEHIAGFAKRGEI